MSDEPSKYRHVVRAVAETPWAILPSTLAVILEIVEFRAAGGELTKEEVRERLDAAEAARTSSRQASAPGAVGVLPLYGVVMPRATLMSEISGGTSLERFAAGFRELLANEQVGSILLDIDSPGGSTDMVPETAALIRSARGRKPIVAIANTDAASAAYWLASQADELIVTPSGMVGSIGVFAAHDDISVLQEKLGVKTTLIYAGKFKTELSPFEPLSEEARAAIQARVDEFYGLFVGDVAKGRGTDVASVRDGFGQGRMVTAKAAVKAGMADAVATFDETVARLARGQATSSRTKAEQIAEADDLAVDEPAADPIPALVSGAERLMSRRAVRDAFSQ
jgi:signal peptide peptidase SppA